jgi:twitching motility protein PilT
MARARLAAPVAAECAHSSGCAGVNVARVGDMSAIVSLLRVMTLRDAEAIVLEANAVPSLRRRGQLEPMAMPAIEAKLLEEFVAPYIEGKDLGAGPVMVPITVEGGAYVATIERGPKGLKLNVRRGAPAAAAKPAPKPAAPKPSPSVSPSPAPAPAPSPSPSPSLVDARHHAGHLLEAAVAIARDRKASDIILTTGQPPHLRVEGRVEPLELALDDAELAACVDGLVGSVGSHDLSLELAGARVRVNAFVHLGGHAIAARLISDRVPQLSDLALPAELAQIVEHRDGLVLVCGPTGSGKSTTLAALVDQLDQRRAAHVITIEDPIEYRFSPRRCLVHQRELGTHVPTFADGLRAALREAPDVILLGELRDRETLAAALTAAETGHLVLATLHAPSAVGAVDRVIDAFPDSHQRQIRVQLAASLRAIVTQYLLPRRDGGRAAAVEYVPVTTAVANIIRKGELHTLPTAVQSGRDAGMIPLERSLARLMDSGVVSPQVVKRVAADHDLLASLAGKTR